MKRINSFCMILLRYYLILFYSNVLKNWPNKFHWIIKQNRLKCYLFILKIRIIYLKNVLFFKIFFLKSRMCTHLENLKFSGDFYKSGKTCKCQWFFLSQGIYWTMIQVKKKFNIKLISNNVFLIFKSNLYWIYTDSNQTSFYHF